MRNNHIPVELPSGYIDFFKNLESWENEQQIFLSQKYEYKSVDIGHLLKLHQQPLLKTNSIHIDSNDYKSLVIGILNFLNEHRPEISDSINSIQKQAEDLNYSDIVQALLSDDKSYFVSLSEKLSVPYELLLFILDHALRPFLRIYAAPYQEFLANDEYQSWDKPTTCPICGAESHISRLRVNDGRRFMFCDRCFSEWETRYLECVHCGNNEPGSIKYISVENNESYQIFVCDKCKGYLKTFDERVNGVTTDLFIANMETIYLDLLAQDKGYSNIPIDDSAN